MKPRAVARPRRASCASSVASGADDALRCRPVKCGPAATACAKPSSTGLPHACPARAVSISLRAPARSAFEALSRGARAATLIERDAAVFAHLQDMRARLEAERADILRYDALAWLAAAPVTAYDIVFVDPPFGSALAAPVLARLAQGWVAADGVVYVEAPEAPVLPPGWAILKQGRTRQVVFSLVAPAAADTANESVE
jgi:hypothetical protein